MIGSTRDTAKFKPPTVPIAKPRRGRIDVVERAIEILGPLDEAQRRLLLEIADECLVHRTLRGEIKVDCRLVG